ncbi:MAG: hypothetical protein A3J59_03885 [Candidatus Buchananbacteria bacterium RIFCSPHIGHO2_02_FULL_56_16]|uniref:DUF3105 domain-containing protein n=1 Tax=Candidatus Buchananbacteria bacterium RIFCSPHIGHO2_02_FULL_56_16 TaxID=1797542 RepID=A0A1G1YIB4_9BACT|nr:MAG: hypothetical protein A3J59_03885 [Candidatus Buchananbacteria bacterium RIFCSPHIGHO2_02_FULL_56_16]
MQIVNQPPINAAVRPTKRERRQLKREKYESEQQRGQQKKMVAKLTKYGVLILVVGGVGYGIFRAGARPRPGETVVDLGNQHIASVTANHAPYNTFPPTSGPHVGDKAVAGIHTEQIPDELQLHNLEDGEVIIHYDPSRITADTVRELEALVNGYREKMLLEPYINPALPAPIVLTAWTKIDQLETFDQERIVNFIKAYQGIDHHKQTTKL